MKKTKIVATIGPASSDPATVRRLIDAGMNVARLNFSHGDHRQHRASFDTIRRVADEAGTPVGVLGDLSGPKIRVGAMSGGEVRLETGSELTIATDEVLGTADRFSTGYEALADDVRPGDPILLDDGLIRLEVLKIAGSEVRCRVLVGGPLRDHKGMNLPGTPLSVPALTDKDRDDLRLGLELGLDFFALSFVRRPDDVVEAKRLAGDTPVIAKIEKPEAIEACGAIADVADGLMVARGDLGVEAGFDKVPLMQKRLIRDGASRGKPVIVATQMLESMIASPVPSRAEVSDVANAVLDGADALMLSAETAVGGYPVEAVQRMAAVIEEVESSELYRLQPEPVRIDEYSFDNAIARAAVKAARDLDLKALAVYTESGHTAKLVSAYRPGAAILGMSRLDESRRRMALLWGVTPVAIDHWITDVQEGLAVVEDTVIRHGVCDPGDDIGVTFGMLEISGPGRTNVLTLWRVRQPAT
jgi:pyruvate kinase